MEAKLLSDLDQKYRGRLFSLAKRMLGDHETAEEVVQDAFLIVSNKYKDFRGESEVFTWMYRITSNLCLKAKSALSRRRIETSYAEIQELKSDYAFTGQKDLEALRDNPETKYLYNELINDVKRECHFMLLGLLTKEQRLVFLMRSQDKLKFQEIAEILQISENAAKARMNRALTIIAEDQKQRCSLCDSNNSCKCEDCAAYIIYKNPDILKKMKEK